MKPFEQQNYYELLEVPLSASPEDIRSAYERALEFYSPDSVALYALVDADQLDTLRKRLTEAVEYLTDAQLRAEYDRTLGVASSAANTLVPPRPSLVEKAPEVKEEPARAAPEPEAVSPAPVSVQAAEALSEPTPSVSAEPPRATVAPEPVTPAAPVSAQAEPTPAPETRAEPQPVPVPVPIAYGPRVGTSFTSAAFFTSFILPVQPLPTPVAEGQAKKPEPVAAPVAEPTPAPVSVAEVAPVSPIR